MKLTEYSATKTDLDIHDMSGANFVETDLKPFMFTFNGWSFTALLRLLEGKRRTLEMRSQFSPVSVL